MTSNSFQKNRTNWAWDLSMQKVTQLKTNKSAKEKKKKEKREKNNKGSERVTKQSVGWGELWRPALLFRWLWE